MEEKNNLYPRNFLLWNKIGFCANNMKDSVNAILNLPTRPTSATVGFVGIPASIACMENDMIFNAYNNLTYVSIDGMPIVKKCRKVGIDCERCTGPDTMLLLIEESVKLGKTHYFYGGKNDAVLKNIKKNLTVKFPGIKITGMYSPPFRDLTEEEDKALCDEINRLHPDFVWVGIGQPRQDYWLETHRKTLKNTTILGVGAAFDFIAGSLERAPEFMQNAGLEWLYRFVKEPKRLWNRYIKGGFKYLYYCTKYPSKKIS
ncbi:WecB/TagA/CpsF family glycosyltransferase [Lachnospiraceae bacterium 62-35]